METIHPQHASGTSTEPTPRYTPAHPLWFDRLCARRSWPRPVVVALVGVLLAMVTVGLAWLSGRADSTTLLRDFRAQFIYPLILVYTLSMTPVVARAGEQVVRGLRPVTQLDDDAYQAVVDGAARISPARELAAVGIGMAIGLAINLLFEPLPPHPDALDHYAYWSRVGNFGVIAWMFLVLLHHTRLTDTLIRQPLTVDPFDLRPFAPIGRQSLVLALTVLGGALLGLLSISWENRALWAEYAIVYAVIVVAIFFFFFWGMRSVHRLLAGVKRRHLDDVDHAIARTYALMRGGPTDPQAAFALATEFNALVAAKGQLRATRTWPFNTEALSTLTVAVFAPVFVGLMRVLALGLGDYLGR